ncbi:hypothetical protein tinsulaeT_26380 [Thalassotalea insulae]|uniref:Acetyltransferase (GNAT) family protein n=1 Tax=Thalassotalea insulae TaxID=2056778 RepID=A0ABQ6GTM9_9GAMM|nr:hypothetical protein [Thalassotalea insulae]GLX79298.1 hypothetical protein tinsulaeT_26380 [Thalassotalea insulae]
MNKLIFKFKHIYKSLFGFWQSHVWIISGSNTKLDQSFTIIHIGSKVQKNYISSLFFDDVSQEDNLGKKNILQIKTLLNKNQHNACYLVADGLPADIKMLRCDKSFFIPQWIDSSLALPLSSKSQGAKSDLKKIRRNNLTYEISNDISDVELFYYHMYLPYLNNRYQGQDIPMKFDKFKQGYQQGTVKLLFVVHENNRVAGQVIDYSKNEPRLWSVGVLNSDKKYLSMAAISACYVFGAQYLTEQNFGSMHIGKSRPFITDGALQFKIKWGTSITGWLDKGFLIKPLANCSNKAPFFEQNPFLYVDTKQLHSAVISPMYHQLEQKQQNELIKRNLTMLPGVRQLNVFEQFDHTSTVQKTYNQ